MNTEKLVSIIVSFYNEERFLGEAIQSVLDSTYTNFELILVDDGSTDESEKVVKSFDDNRIVYIKLETNKGQGNGRNVGLSRARGDYIGFFDGDDLIDKYKLEKQVAYLNENEDIVLVGGGCAYITMDGDIYQEAAETRFLNDEEIKAQMLFSNVIACGGGALFRRSIIDDYGLTFDVSIRSSQDYKFFIDCLKCGKVANLSERLFYYRRGDGRYVSQTTKIRERNWELYHQNMIGIFQHAWTERGFEFSEEDARFIYEHFYGKKTIDIKDRRFNKNLKRRIQRQIESLGLAEGKKIIEYYEEIENARFSKTDIKSICKKIGKRIKGRR